MSKKSCPQRLAEHFGDMTSAATALSKHAYKIYPRVKGLTRQSIHAWILKGYIPEMYALSVDAITGSGITAMEILEEAGAARRRSLAR